LTDLHYFIAMIQCAAQIGILVNDFHFDQFSNLPFAILYRE